MGSESETDPTNGVLTRVVLVQETERATGLFKLPGKRTNEEASGLLVPRLGSILRLRHAG